MNHYPVDPKNCEHTEGASLYASSENRDSERSDLNPQSDSSNGEMGYSNVGRKMADWTSNFLATAVVVIIELAVGTQLVSSFRPAQDVGVVGSEIVNAWPELESCALEFGDSPVQFQRDSIKCNYDDAVANLQSRCRSALEKGEFPEQPLGERESKLIQTVVNSENAQPIEESPGEWRIFHIFSDKDSADIPMVVGFLDKVGGKKSGTKQGDDLKNSRLAVWGLAFPKNSPIENDTSDTKNRGADQVDQEDPKTLTDWTTFLAVPAPETKAEQLKRALIPNQFSRTLAISNPDGGSLIGFRGSSVAKAIGFYDNLEAIGRLKVSVPWEENKDSWSAYFELPRESAFKGIQVQLHVNHNENVRGMLMVQPN